LYIRNGCSKLLCILWQVENENELNEDDDWEYVEEGPAEIIWQGNEIIVKKKKVKVPKKIANHQNRKDVCYINHQLNLIIFFVVCFMFRM
jgi:hypothetical protein